MLQMFMCSNNEHLTSSFPEKKNWAVSIEKKKIYILLYSHYYYIYNTKHLFPDFSEIF